MIFSLIDSHFDISLASSSSSTPSIHSQDELSVLILIYLLRSELLRSIMASSNIHVSQQKCDRPSLAEWDMIKQDAYRLYVEEDNTLEETQESIFVLYNFQAR